MHKLNIHRTGLALGTFVGFMHLVWVLLLGTVGVESKIKFVQGMHFLSIPFSVLPFSWKGGLVLIVLSAIFGYIIGAVFSFIWNKVAVR